MRTGANKGTLRLIGVILAVAIVALLLVAFNYSYAQGREAGKADVLDTSVETKNAYEAEASCEGWSYTILVNGKINITGSGVFHASNRPSPDYTDTNQFGASIIIEQQLGVDIHYKLNNDQTIRSIRLETIGEPALVREEKDIPAGSKGVLSYDTTSLTVDRVTRVSICTVEVGNS